MYCKNCGKVLIEGDKFCSGCGSKVEAERFFSTKGQNPEEAPKKPVRREVFHWDLDGYPSDKTEKTDDISFNWDAVVEEKQRRLFDEKRGMKDIPARETLAPEIEEPSLEEVIFGDIGTLYTDEPTKVIDNSDKTDHSSKVDKFYTFNKKNEEFQTLLDQEYEKIQNGEDEDDELNFEPLFKMEQQEAEQEIPVPLTEEPLAEPVEDNFPSENQDVVFEEEVNPDTLETEDVVAPQVEDEKVEPSAELDPGEYTEQPETEEEVEEIAPIESGEELAEAEVSEDHCPPSAEPKTEEETEPQPKLTFYDVFSGNDDNDDNIKKPKKKTKALKVIAIVMCILISLELIIIGIMFFAKGTPVANKLNDGYLYVVDLFTGQDEAKDKPKAEPKATAITKAIEEKSDSNQNIAIIEEKTAMTFQDETDYGIDGVGTATVSTNRSWYTDDDGDTVTYTDEIVGTLIKYYSAWVDKYNGKDDKILQYVEDASDLYAEVQQMEGEAGVEYGINKLEIGEIREGNTGFYVLTTVTKVDSKTKEETSENNIVYMEAIEKTMKIVNINRI